MTTFSLRTLKLRSGEEFRDAQEVELPMLDFGGERYVPVPQEVPAELVITRATTGTVFQLAFRGRLHGPCYRCLRDAVIDLPISAREYHATNADSDELKNPYVVDDRLDLSAWARDAIVLALPVKILCRPDCAGLCPVCGKNLNEEPHGHVEEQTDPRWEALAALRDKLETQTPQGSGS
ncbi:MAG: DUF177 domain-containing protein [Actinobacteria bacterium]|nr:DUF177 domain-containing protein [Actinomycetota bacterium]